MSGHSKWSSIKHKKAATDARRGQLFTKLGRELTISARHGGGDPTANVQLRLAIQKARDANMPMENIERAIKRGGGSGDAAGEQFEEVTYEGYGPGGVAVLLQALTDNRNRTVSDVRGVFARGGGNLGEAGCVAWLFESRGVITVEETDPARADELALVAIDAGALDFHLDDDVLELYSDPEHFEGIRNEIQEHDTRVASAEMAMVPKTTVALGEKEAEQTLRLLDKLEELDDVQRVFTNAEFPDAVVERYRNEG